MSGSYSRLVRITNDISVGKKSLILLASVLTGLFAALPTLMDRTSAIRDVGNGLSSGAPSLGERAAALAFQAGGWVLSDAIRVAFAATPWILGSLLLFWGALRLGGRIRVMAIAVVSLLCLVVSLLGIQAGFLPASQPLSDPRLVAPLSLIEMLKGKRGRIFMNPSAGPLVAPFGLDLIDQTLTVKQASVLSNSPEEWRAEDRADPFSAVLVAGRAHEAKPLIRHLLESPDWYLARLDNQGLLFLHGPNPDISAIPIPEFSTPMDRAVFLAQYALNLETAGFRTLAASSMDEALSLAGKDYEILFRASSLSASQGKWERARKQAAAAYKARPGYEAKYLLALSLLETRAFEKSYEETSKLRDEYPQDSNVLLLHARAARAAKEYADETKTLEGLLKLAKENGAPTTRIHIFLAQSWAQRGFPAQAISAYKTALAEGPAEAEAREIRAAISTIEDNRLKE